MNGFGGGGGQQGGAPGMPAGFNPAQTQQLLAQMQMMAAAQQQQQQQQQQQPPQQPQQQQPGPSMQPQMNGAGPNANGAMAAPQIPPQQLQQMQQNPGQMLQAITGQIGNLQRQWATVQAQPDSQQKVDASQQLAAQMKRMRAFQAHTLQILQKQQQQPGSTPQQTTGAPSTPQAAPQTPIASAPTPQPSTSLPQGSQQPNAGGNNAAATPQSTTGAPGEPATPAHSAQLAALQAFAQQQRMQSLHHPSPVQSMPGQPGQPAQQAQATPAGGAGTKGDLVGAVRAFMAQRGTPFPPDMPTTFTAPAKGQAPGSTNGEIRTVDMQTLFGTVVQFGGSLRIAAQPNGWAIIASQLGFAVAPIPPTHQPGQNELDGNGLPLPPFVAPRLSQFYRERFGAFEETWMARFKGGQNAQIGQAQSQGQQPMQPGQTGQAQGQPAPGAMNGQSTPASGSGGMPGSQPAQSPAEALRKAQELQAQLPQQMQQLQELLKAGKITQQQAKERYLFLQNATRMALLQSQTQPSTAPPAGPAPADPAQQPPSTPVLQQQQQQRPPPSTPLNAATPAPSTPAQQQVTPAASEAKKPSKRSRKSSAKQPPPTPSATDADDKGDVSMDGPGEGSVSNDTKPTAPAAGTSSGGPTIGAAGIPPASQPSIQAANAHARQALQALHQGITNPGQQVAAFMAIRSAAIQMQGGTVGPEVTTLGQTQAQVYARVLAQAQNAGQPLNVAAPVAFAAAQQEINRPPNVKRPSDAATSLPTLVNGQASAPPTPSTATGGPAGSAALGNSLPVTPAAPPPKPGKFKIEYMPIRRDVRSFGGWDLDATDNQLGPLLFGHRRFPRSVRDLGFVDVEGLIMSLRSRLEVEVTYALNALLILTAGVQAPGFHLVLTQCEDLGDELLDLLEDAAFGRLHYGDEKPLDAEEDLEVGPIAMPLKALSHADWVEGALEDESENKVRIVRKRKRHHTSTGLTNGLSGKAHDNINEIAILAEADGEGLDVEQMSPIVVDVSGEEEDHTPAPAADSSRGEEDREPTDYYDRLANQRTLSRQADIAIVLLEILLNLAMIPENHGYFNGEPRFYALLMKMAAAVEHEELARRVEVKRKQHDTPSLTALIRGIDPAEEERPPWQTVFTPTEALRVRKEILALIAALAGESSLLTNLDNLTLANLFDFLASFVYDAGEIEQLHGLVLREVPLAPPRPPTAQDPHPSPPPMALQPVARKVPQHADLALEALSSLGQPDVNRQAWGETVSQDKLIRLGQTLLHLLPVSELDFNLLKTEARLAFCERIAMTLFDLAYMGGAVVKRHLRDMPGAKRILFRCVRRLMRIHKDFSQNPFSVLTRRLVELLRLLSDGDEMFHRPALLGFGMESGGRTATRTHAAKEGGIRSTPTTATATALTSLTSTAQALSAGRTVSIIHRQDGNLLVEDEEAVVELMTVEGIDPTVIAELERML